MRISQHPSSELLQVENWQLISQKLICLHTGKKNTAGDVEKEVLNTPE